MRSKTRRRNRLRSAQYSTERWKPPLTFVVLFVGLIVGIALGLTNRSSAQQASIQQHYMLLVSDLYAQGVPLSNVRDRLTSLGYANPSVAVLAVADQLAHSSDTVSQQEADQLHHFAEALVAGPDSEPASGAETQASPTTIPAPATSTASVAAPVSTILATTTPTSVPTEAVTPTSIPASDTQENVAPSPTPRPSPTPVPVIKATAAPEKPGVVHTAGHQPAILRAGWTTKSTAVAIVPDGAKVAVYGVVHGEALEPGEARWYHIVYSGKQGYLYYKLIQLGG